MSGDDKETIEPARSVRLPDRVERALRGAREAARADQQRKAGRWLAVVPVSIGVILLALLMPRSAPPESVPLPRVDGRVIAAIEKADDSRAATAESERLPTYVLAVGTQLRVLHALDVRGGDEVERIDARRRLDGAVRDLPKDSVETELLSLRSLQLRRFLDAIQHWEATGQRNDDLTELGGSFLQRAEDAGWVKDRRLLMSDTERRVAFKVVWNTLVGVDTHPAFALSLDEQRAIHAFYIRHPRPPESHRLALALERESATTPEACARVNLEERRQAEMWRADKIKRLGSIDPSYPTEVALGVAYYRAGRYDLSAEAFTAYIARHPDGAYALRAKNHLKAALTTPYSP